MEHRQQSLKHNLIRYKSVRLKRSNMRNNQFELCMNMCNHMVAYTHQIGSKLLRAHSLSSRMIDDSIENHWYRFDASNALIHTNSICGDINRPLFIRSMNIFASMHSHVDHIVEQVCNGPMKTRFFFLSTTWKVERSEKNTRRNAFKKSFGNFTYVWVCVRAVCAVCAMCSMCSCWLCVCVGLCKRWPHFHWFGARLYLVSSQSHNGTKATSCERAAHIFSYLHAAFTPNAWFLFCFLWFLNDRTWRCTRTRRTGVWWICIRMMKSNWKQAFRFN